MKREGVKQVRQPTTASSSPATSTKGTGKSWFVRVLTGLGICLMLAVLRMLSLYVKNGGLSSLRSEPVDEGPTIRVQQPDAGMVLTTRQSASSGKKKAGDEEDEEDAEEAPPPPPPPAAKKIPPTLKEIESGLYRPDTSRKLEHYAGAWLISKRRLLEARSYIKAIRSLEGASFAVAGMAAHRDPRITLMTRDFFDFSVQHLSSTTNQLPSGSTRAFLDVIHEQTVSGVGRLRARAEARRDHPTHVSPLSSDERRTELTVAVIPFCNRAASIDPRLETEMYVDFNVKVRLLFFQATFWSVYRAFPRIVVTVGTEEDLQTVMAMHLPIFKTVNMKALFNVSAPLRQPGSVHFLPRETLLFLIDKLTDKRSADFARFQYVYYTEADHILQLRSPDQLFNAIDGSGGKYAIAPHRLQVGCGFALLRTLSLCPSSFSPSLPLFSPLLPLFLSTSPHSLAISDHCHAAGLPQVQALMARQPLAGAPNSKPRQQDARGRARGSSGQLLRRRPLLFRQLRQLVVQLPKLGLKELFLLGALRGIRIHAADGHGARGSVRLLASSEALPRAGAVRREGSQARRRRV